MHEGGWRVLHIQPPFFLFTLSLALPPAAGGNKVVASPAPSGEARRVAWCCLSVCWTEGGAVEMEWEVWPVGKTQRAAGNTGALVGRGDDVCDSTVQRVRAARGRGRGEW